MLAANRVFYAALRDRDLAAMEAVWANGADVACIHPGGQPLTGWDAVRASWELIVRDEEVTAVEGEVVDLSVVDPVAWLTCVERIAMSGHGGRGQVEFVATNVFVLGAEGWRMTLHHASGVA